MWRCVVCHVFQPALWQAHKDPPLAMPSLRSGGHVGNWGVWFTVGGAFCGRVPELADHQRYIRRASKARALGGTEASVLCRPHAAATHQQREMEPLARSAGRPTSHSHLSRRDQPCTLRARVRQLPARPRFHWEHDIFIERHKRRLATASQGRLRLHDGRLRGTL